MEMLNNDAYKTQRNTNKHAEAQMQCYSSPARTHMVVQTDTQTHRRLTTPRQAMDDYLVAHRPLS